jgi:hypothetical protein
MKGIRTVLRAIFLFLPALLAACQPVSVTQPQNGSHVSRSKGIGLVQWENIPAAEAKISIVDEGDAVLARREKKEERRSLLSQAFLLKNGSLLYEKRDNISPEAKVYNPAREIVNRYGAHPELLSQGLTLQEDKIVAAPALPGDFSYALTESAKKKCVVFFGYSPDSVVKTETAEPVRHYQALSGTICAAPGTRKRRRSNGIPLPCWAGFCLMMVHIPGSSSWPRRLRNSTGSRSSGCGKWKGIRPARKFRSPILWQWSGTKR